jgi:hypothetical protein
LVQATGSNPQTDWCSSISPPGQTAMGINVVIVITKYVTKT